MPTLFIIQLRLLASHSLCRIHLGILVMLLVAVLYLALFVNVGASDNFWLMFLWRAITVILPLFLIIRCVAALYAWRQQYVASRM